MDGIKLGQYVHGNSFLHRLDPRSKILCCLIIIAAVLFSYNWLYLSFFLLLMIASIIIAGMNFKYVFGSLRTIRYLLLVTFVFQAILTPGEAVFTMGKMQITLEGLTNGSLNLLRLLILYLGSLLLLMTTSPLALSTGIEYLLLPFSRFNIPVHNLSTVLGISFRFLPTLAEETTTIKKAQSSRGAQFEAPRIIVRLKSYLAILIPLFESSLTRAEELGEAMDSRGFTIHPNRLRMSRLKWQLRDTAALLFISAAAISSLLYSCIK